MFSTHRRLGSKSRKEDETWYNLWGIRPTTTKRWQLLEMHSFTVIQNLPWIHHYYSFCSDVTEHMYSRIPVRLNHKITTSYYFNGLCKYQKDWWWKQRGRKKNRETGIPVCHNLKQTWVPHTVTAISHPSHVHVNTHTNMHHHPTLSQGDISVHFFLTAFSWHLFLFKVQSDIYFRYRSHALKYWKDTFPHTNFMKLEKGTLLGVRRRAFRCGQYMTLRCVKNR